MPTPAEDEETAKFHYAEGNKFGLEFAKSLFLFNSALLVALIAYVAAKTDTRRHRWGSKERSCLSGWRGSFR